MIYPVRPVGWPAGAVSCALSTACYRLAWTYARCSKLWIPWIQLPLAIRLRALLAEGAVAAAVRRSQTLGLPDSPLLQATPPQLAPAEQWQPWPAHPAFIDEVTRWWPSDEAPPVKPPIVIEDKIPDVPPEIVDWTSRGSLLDSWM